MRTEIDNTFITKIGCAVVVTTETRPTNSTLIFTFHALVTGVGRLSIITNVRKAEIIWIALHQLRPELISA